MHGGELPLIKLKVSNKKKEARYSMEGPIWVHHACNKKRGGNSARHMHAHAWKDDCHFIAHLDPPPFTWSPDTSDNNAGYIPTERCWKTQCNTRIELNFWSCDGLICPETRKAGSSLGHQKYWKSVVPYHLCKNLLRLQCAQIAYAKSLSIHGLIACNLASY